MDSTMDTRIDSDKRGIVELEVDESSSTSSKMFKTHCCTNRYVTTPIILSIIALFLAMGTVFGVAIRWSQMNNELQNLSSQLQKLQIITESLEIQTTAQRSISLANKQTISASSKQKSASSPPGSTYIHWGRATCNSGATLLYSGFGAGAASSSRARGGGGSEYLCMPRVPEYNRFDISNDSAAHSWLYASEYLTFKTGIHSDALHGHNTVCSVCLAPRSAKLMIPAKRSCPTYWTKEYEGYLMSSYVTDRKMSYVCVDENPDVVAGTKNVTGGALLYYVSGYCGTYGGLAHCPPYVSARELACVVCTK